jgi:hypothetical protein
MSKQADVQVPEEAVKAAQAATGSTDAWCELALAAALPSLIDHFRERLLSDEVVDAAARHAESRWAYAVGDPAHARIRSSIRRELEAALATAFKDNTDSQGG